jgi:hypothetical protein
MNPTTTDQTTTPSEETQQPLHTILDRSINDQQNEAAHHRTNPGTAPALPQTPQRDNAWPATPALTRSSSSKKNHRQTAASIKKARVPSSLKQKLQSKLSNLSLVRVQQGTPTPPNRKPRGQNFGKNNPTQSATNTRTPPAAREKETGQTTATTEGTPTGGPGSAPGALRHNINDGHSIMALEPPPRDEAFKRREEAQGAFAQHDNAFGRFIVRDATHLTDADLQALSEGNNNLLLLAEDHAGMTLESFLNLVFEGWNTATAPAAMPKKATRIASDSGIPCGVFARDAYNKADRQKMTKANKSAAELGLEKPKAHRRKGQTVFLKIYPAMLRTKSEFVCAAQTWVSEDDVTLVGGRVFGDYFLTALSNYDEKDEVACRTWNINMLVWLVRYRLWTWYSTQKDRGWSQEVLHFQLPTETQFVPMIPIRTAQQMFGSALHAELRIAGALAIEPQGVTPNGVRRSGQPVTMSDVVQLDLYRREPEALDAMQVDQPEIDEWEMQSNEGTQNSDDLYNSN